MKKYKERDQSFSDSSLVINYHLSPQRAVPPINPTDALFSWKSACCCCRHHCLCCHYHRCLQRCKELWGIFRGEDLSLGSKAAPSLSQTHKLTPLVQAHTHMHAHISHLTKSMCASSHRQTHSLNHKGKHETCCLQPQGHGSNVRQCMAVNEKKLAQWCRQRILGEQSG